MDFNELMNKFFKKMIYFFNFLNVFGGFVIMEIYK